MMPSCTMLPILSDCFFPFPASLPRRAYALMLKLNCRSSTKSRHRLTFYVIYPFIAQELFMPLEKIGVGIYDLEKLFYSLS